MSEEESLVFWAGRCGALVCNQPIDGVTQHLRDGPAAFYGGDPEVRSVHFVGETMTTPAMRVIAKLLGGTFDSGRHDHSPW